ncbi:hypothetical protein Syun_018771 [Stephania yunnanensis]|uniref:Uncharacterized protein n=1 Tax=Stephania yunnanensis TaxID=152371 RepID=A0AAP0ISW0_9MAGN
MVSLFKQGWLLEQVSTMLKGTILPANPNILEDIDDLVQLSFLNEPSVLYNLCYRYSQSKSYGKLIDIHFKPTGKVFGAKIQTCKFHLDFKVEKYWSETMEGLEIFQIESEIIIAQDEKEENEMKTKVISEKPEEPRKKCKEYQHLVFMKAPTLPCIFVKPYKGVEVKERSQIFYTADTLCWIIMMR